jgi:hypothetical protein
MAFAMRQRKKMRKGVGVGSDDVWKRRGGSTVTRGGSGGAWWPAPAEAGDARPACYAGDVGKGGERKERPRARGPLWAR